MQHIPICCKMKRTIVYPFLALLLAGAACKKTAEKQPPPEPVQTERGTVLHLLAEKVIDAAGGHLSDAEGTVSVTVPPGAVSAPARFAIHAINNTVNARRKAYRLSPEGALKAPVTATFHYTASDLENTAEELMTVFFQQQNGTWKVVPAVLDKAERTLTVTTSHFSDWMINGAFEMYTPTPVIQVGEEARLRMMGVHEDLLAPLLPWMDFEHVTAAGSWKIIKGQGVLTPVPVEHKPRLAIEAIYKADVSESQTVEVSAEVEGFNLVKDPAAPGGYRRTGKVIMVTPIMVVNEAYMNGALEEHSIRFTEVAAVDNGRIVINGTHQGFTVAILVNSNKEGSYPCGMMGEAGKSAVIVTNGTLLPPLGFSSSYTECHPPFATKHSSGNVVIRKWGKVGELVEGEFNGTLYAEGCNTKQKKLTVSFRARRSL